MRWSWDELQALPMDVYAELVEMLNEEQDEAQGPGLHFRA